MTRDPQLSLFASQPDSANVAYLVKLLRDAKRWMTASEIGTQVADLWNDRQIRSLAEAAGPEIISGQRGYRHIEHATAEEIHHAAAWLESQGSKMIDRSRKIRIRAHQLVG